MIKAKDFLKLRTEEERRRIVEPFSEDRPMIVQFASDNPEEFLQAALLVQDWCDAVDLNLGCPQVCRNTGIIFFETYCCKKPLLFEDYAKLFEWIWAALR